MKKLALVSALFCATCFTIYNPVKAGSYEPTYVAVCCDYMGFDACVNYDCTRPKPNN